MARPGPTPLQRSAREVGLVVLWIAMPAIFPRVGRVLRRRATMESKALAGTVAVDWAWRFWFLQWAKPRLLAGLEEGEELKRTLRSELGREPTPEELGEALGQRLDR